MNLHYIELINQGGLCMLILTRRISEAIMIGDDIVLRVVGVTSQTAKFAIKAPKGVNIKRTRAKQAQLSAQHTAKKIN